MGMCCIENFNVRTIMKTVCKNLLIKTLENIHERLFKHAMSPTMRDFLVHLAWSFLGIVFSGIILFVINILAGRLLGPEEYGKYNLVLVIANILIIPILLGMDTTSIKYISENVAEKVKERYLSNSFWLVVSTSSIFILLFFLFADGVSQYFGINKEILAVALIYAVITSFKNLLDGFIRGFHFFKFQSIAKAVEGIVALTIFSVLFLFLNQYNYESYIAVMTLGFFVVSLIYFFKIRKKIVGVDLVNLKNIINYSKTNLTFIITVTIMVSMDKLFVSKIFGLRDVGIYSAYLASTTIIVFQFMTIFDNIFFPIVNKEKNRSVIIKKIDRLSVLLFLPTTLLIFACSYGVMSIFGKEYSANAAYCMLFSMIAYLLIPGGFYKSIALTRERSYNNFKKLFLIDPPLFFLIYMYLFMNKIDNFLFIILMYGLYVGSVLLFARLSCNYEECYE